MDQLGNGVAFYNHALKANYVADDANTYSVQGKAGSIFEGLSFGFDNGSLFYDVTFPDVISPTGGATSSLEYVGGTGGTAAIEYAPTSGEGGRVVMFGFPFETMTSAAARAETMEAVLEFFGMRNLPNGDFDNNGLLDCEDLLLLSLAVNAEDEDFDLNADGSVTGEDITFWITEIKQTLPGDANLDFVVDTSDFNIWNSGKFTSGFWCTGDFTGNFLVDASDFNVWNANKFNSVLPAAAAAVLPPRAAGQAHEVRLADKPARKEVIITDSPTEVRWLTPLQVRPNEESERTPARRREMTAEYETDAMTDRKW